MIFSCGFSDLIIFYCIYFFILFRFNQIKQSFHLLRVLQINQLTQPQKIQKPHHKPHTLSKKLFIQIKRKMENSQQPKQQKTTKKKNNPCKRIYFDFQLCVKKQGFNDRECKCNYRLLAQIIFKNIKVVLKRLKICDWIARKDKYTHYVHKFDIQGSVPFRKLSYNLQLRQSFDQLHKKLIKPQFLLFFLQFQPDFQLNISKIIQSIQTSFNLIQKSIQNIKILFIKNKIPFQKFTLNHNIKVNIIHNSFQFRSQIQNKLILQYLQKSMKKKQVQSIQDPNKLNADFLLKFAKLNYEAKNINFQMLNAFSNFLQYVTDSLLKQPQNYSQQIIKALIDIAITVEFNLHMTQDFLSFQIQPVLKFMEVLFNFADKVFNYQCKPNKDKAYQIIDIFWPLLNNQQQINKVEVKEFKKIQETLQKITNLPYIYEIESRPLKLNSNSVLTQAVEISFLNQKIDFSILFRSALVIYNQVNKGFFQSFLTFFEHIMNESNSSKQNKANFSKCLNILLNITNSIGQKYNYIQIFFNRIIKSINFIRNFIYALSPGSGDKSATETQANIEKYYSHDNLLSLSLLILEKIISFRYMNKQMCEALQIISKLSQNWYDLQFQVMKKIDLNKLNVQFVSKIIKFLANQNKSGPQYTALSSLSQIFQNSGFQSQKSLIQSQQLDEKKLFEFIRQCKIRTQSQDGQQDMAENRIPIKRQSSQTNQYQSKIIKSFQKILFNLSLNPYIRQKIKFQSIQKLEQTVYSSSQKSSNQSDQFSTLPELSSLMNSCFPTLISQEWLQNLIQKYILSDSKIKSVMYDFIVKKIESVDTFSKFKHDFDFSSFITKVFSVEEGESKSNEVLNFHFVLFYLYFKKCSTLAQKQQVAQLQNMTKTILTQLLQLLKLKSAQSQRIPSQQIPRQTSQAQNPYLLKQKILSLQIFLLLILDNPSCSYKITIKKYFSLLSNNDKNTTHNKLHNQISVNSFISINQKEIATNFMNSNKIKLILCQKQVQTPNKLHQLFLSYIALLNTLYFNTPQTISSSTNLSLIGQSKQQKNINIFINIKMNNIAVQINKNFKIPEFIENINLIKKFNTVNNQLELLLFIFEEYCNQEMFQKVKGLFGENGKEQNGGKINRKLEESPIIVLFNYLLKIYAEIGSFDEKELGNSQMEEKVLQQINQLKIIHITLQQSLQHIQKLLLITNPPFQLSLLIKLLKNIKQSTSSLNYSLIIDKYLQMMTQCQTVKLISEITQNQQKLKIQWSQLCLLVFKKLLEKDGKIVERIKQLESIKMENVDNKIVEQNEEKIQLQVNDQENKLMNKQIKDLSNSLKKLYLIYFPYKNSMNQANYLKIKMEISILQLLAIQQQAYVSQKVILPKQRLLQYQQIYKFIIDDLLKNVNILKDIIIKEAAQYDRKQLKTGQQAQNKSQDQGLLWNFQYKNQTKFISYIINSILKMFNKSNNHQKIKNKMIEQDDRIFVIASQLLDNQQICKLAQKQIGTKFKDSLIAMTSQRIDQGIKLVKTSPIAQSPFSPTKKKKSSSSNKQASKNNKAKQINDFHLASQKIYTIIKKIIKLEQINVNQIINCIINKDEENLPQVTEFLLKQILNIAEFIKVKKSQELTESVFSYLIKINSKQLYKQKKYQLFIPQFICQFFNISNSNKNSKQLKNLQKSQRSTNSCSINPFYKCLKCDDKRYICYGCMVQCHKDHPVIYCSEVKIPRCQCRQLADDKCKLIKKANPADLNKQIKSHPISSNIFAYEKRPYRGARGQFFMPGDDERIDLALGAYDDDQYFHQIHKFGGDRYGGDRFGADRYGNRRRNPRQVQKFQMLQKQGLFVSQLQSRQNPFGHGMIRQQKKVQQKATNQQNFDFQEENYEQNNQMELQKSPSSQIQSQIVSQSYYLPVFLQMFNQMYSGSEEISVHKIQSEHQKFGFDSISQGKVMFSTWKATNAGCYNVRLRKENHLNNKSPSVSKQVIAQNQKFIIIASGTMLSVHLKERFLLQILQGKATSAFPNVHQHSITFDVHTIDFSPLDDFTFCIAGLHTIIVFTLTGQGIITRTNSRISVNNDYINKVRTSHLGIFYSTSNQIRLLNWSFKQVLSIRSSSECLLKEWCLYQKNQNSTIYCVTSQGYTQFIDVSATDEGKKYFTNKVSDHRKIIDTGASVLVKDVQKIGKVFLASFKDGSNLIGNIEGDSTQNISLFAMKNNFVDILGKKYVIGQSQIIKGVQNEVFVVCTVKQTLNPQNSIHQGSLVVFKIRKDRKCQLNLINPDNKCEYFSVIHIGDMNWAIISLHDDGSLQFSVLNKPLKQVIDSQCKKLKQIQPQNTEKNNQKSSHVKQSIKKIINQEMLENMQLQPLHYFRQFSDMLKTSSDVKIVKKKDDYEVTLMNTGKVITGISLPFFGNVYLPHRTIKNCMEIGLSNLQILHFYAEGSLKFRAQKIQDSKYTRQNMNQRFLEKLEKLQRLNQLALDNQRATQLLNTIKQSQMLSDEVTMYGQTFDAFKNRLQNFNQIFNEEQNTGKKDQKIQKMAIILKLFIEDSIKKQNYTCQPFQILQFVKNLRKISLNVNTQTYHIIKQLIISSLKMYESITQVKTHVFNDQYYPLKYSTQLKAQFYYEILKGQTSDSQVQEITEFFSQICDQDTALALLYMARYPSLMVKIQKKSKKIDKNSMNNNLLKLYIISYQILKYKDHTCDWILSAICSIFSSQLKNKNLRQNFYKYLKKYANLKIQAWIKNVIQIDGQQNVSDINIVNKPSSQPQQNLGSQNNMASFYNQFSMGQMDEQAMLRMALQMSQMQFKQQQQQNYNFDNKNPIEEQKQDHSEEQMVMESQMMELQDQKHQSNKKSFLIDLIEFCTKDLSQPNDIAASKIVVLYVIQKYVNQSENEYVFCFILERIHKIISQLTTNCDNYDKHVLMAYFSVFSNILYSSKILKDKSSQEATILYLKIKKQVEDRLQNVKPQKVNKLKCNPNLLGKIFRGQKIYTFAHYAYGLISLLLPPCEPSHILLALQCYWLLPQSKQYYTKMKNMTTIKQGINTGNIDKIYEVSTKYPDIWKQTADIQWIQAWIQQKKNNWQRALSLLALYYEGQQGKNQKQL